MGIAMFFKRKEAFEEIFLYYLLINIMQQWWAMQFISEVLYIDLDLRGRAGTQSDRSATLKKPLYVW